MGTPKSSVKKIVALGRPVMRGGWTKVAVSSSPSMRPRITATATLFPHIRGFQPTIWSSRSSWSGSLVKA